MTTLLQSIKSIGAIVILISLFMCILYLNSKQNCRHLPGMIASYLKVLYVVQKIVLSPTDRYYSIKVNLPYRSFREFGAQYNLNNLAKICLQS